MIKFLTIIALLGIAIADPIPNLLSRNGFSQGRIINGEDTAIEEVPYQVSISVHTMHYCGGIIIDKNWILTAAHCATLPPEHYSIRAGSSHRNTGGSIHKVSRIVSHKKFIEDDFGIPTNDIALFRLATPIEMDATRHSIELYEVGEETEVGVYGVVSGWGNTNTSSPNTPQVLQSVSVPIVSKADCMEAYDGLFVVYPDQICTGYPKGGKDACQGDSGGPLVIDGRLAGIVSWAFGCALPGFPGVYTEVAYFREWISEAMEE